MAKKTQRRAAARQERDQLGCMWGFMNMFNFRHGPLAHKLLLEPKHPRNNELHKSKCREKDAQENHVSFSLTGNILNFFVVVFRVSCGLT